MQRKNRFSRGKRKLEAIGKERNSEGRVGNLVQKRRGGGAGDGRKASERDGYVTAKQRNNVWEGVKKAKTEKRIKRMVTL